jgi:hypothetical protein
MDLLTPLFKAIGAFAHIGAALALGAALLLGWYGKARSYDGTRLQNHPR